MSREKFTPSINKSIRSLSLADFKSNVDKSTKTKIEHNFQLPKILDKKFNASDKSSPITIIKYSGKIMNKKMKRKRIFF